MQCACTWCAHACMTTTTTTNSKHFLQHLPVCCSFWFWLELCELAGVFPISNQPTNHSFIHPSISSFAASTFANRFLHLIRFMSRISNFIQSVRICDAYIVKTLLWQIGKLLFSIRFHELSRSVLLSHSHSAHMRYTLNSVQANSAVHSAQCTKCIYAIIPCRTSVSLTKSV